MRLVLLLLGGLSAAWLAIGPSLAAAAEGGAIDFNRDIRPILSENCFYCHGQDPNKRQADLRLDARDEALRSAAIVPRDVAASLLVERIRSTDPAQQMPPAKSNRRLSEGQKQLLERWIAEGAEYSAHWAFVRPQRPTPPAVRNSNWVRNPIDQFILSVLEKEQLAPAPEADRATLIKRLYVDLAGLPPTPDEVEAFVADSQEGAYERLVDRLLSSPRYGERLSLPWLDTARYADSNGFQQDGDTWQWMWRDWVVRALNANLPFDQFTTQQLAGDLLPNATDDQKVASGFNRNHLLNGEGGAIPEEQRFVNLFDRMDTTSTTWLGLTMACAQCHDHKYDPLTMRDYYGMLDGFNRVPETGTPQFFSSRIRVGAPFLELPTAENLARIADFDRQIAAADAAARPLADAAFVGWRTGLFADGKPTEGKGLPEPIVTLLQKPEGERIPEEKETLDKGLRAHFDTKVRGTLSGQLPELGRPDELRKQLAAYRADQLPRPMIMSDAQPREMHLLERGDYLSPGEKITFATPAFLPPLPEGAPLNRLGLAQWLVAPEHPLTARVQVNRMWQYFFGAGLVKTAEDFGVQSEYPLHRHLLDWLAVEFREGGWNVKRMHRLILTSATYRQSSRLSAEQRGRDLENRFFARAGRFRMPALVLRDWGLTAAGLLDPRIGGPPVYPYQPDAVWESLAITKERDFTYPLSQGGDLYRRSVYTFWRRTVGPANMFDASNRQTCRVRPSLTSTPLHALTTLNDPTWVEGARVLAEASLHATSDVAGRLEHSFRRIVCRSPTPSDRERLARAYARQLALYQQAPDDAQQLLAVGTAPRDTRLNPAEHAALTAVCLAMLNLDEALCRE